MLCAMNDAGVACVIFEVATKPVLNLFSSAISRIVLSLVESGPIPIISFLVFLPVAIAVADAHPYVLKQADLVTIAKGGKGAVREICDAILSAKGILDDILARYRQ